MIAHGKHITYLSWKVRQREPSLWTRENMLVSREEVIRDWRFVSQRTVKNGIARILLQSENCEIRCWTHLHHRICFGGYFLECVGLFSCIRMIFQMQIKNSCLCNLLKQGYFQLSNKSFIVCLIQYVCWRRYSHPKRKQILPLSVRFAQAENEEIYKRHKCLFDGDWISAIF